MYFKFKILLLLFLTEMTIPRRIPPGCRRRRCASGTTYKVLFGKVKLVGQKISVKKSYNVSAGSSAGIGLCKKRAEKYII